MERADTKPDSLQDNLPVLEVKNLRVQFSSDSGTTTAVVDESFVIHKGETLALVGESGSGKSVTSLSVMRLVEHGGGKIVNGSIHLRCRDGRLVDLMKATRSELQALRGSEVAMIFQEPMTSLNPVFTVGAQIAESLTLHRGMSEAEALKEAVRLLELVRIPDAERVAMRYPHQLSGGMRQRVLIALALIGAPKLLLADEPTTALDVVVQREILSELRDLVRARGMSMLLVTHDLHLARDVADRVAVMYAGTLMEVGPCEKVIPNPSHPYTEGLLNAMPDMESPRGSLKPIEGEVPSPSELGKGCPFASRCVLAETRCRESLPPMIAIAPGWCSRCDNAHTRTADLEKLEELAAAAPEGAGSIKIEKEIDRKGFGSVQKSDFPVIVDARIKKHCYYARRGFFGRKTPWNVLEEVDLQIKSGEVLGLVGESGCGKSTLARLMLGLMRPTLGSVKFRDEEYPEPRTAPWRAQRAAAQMIYQDPFSCFDERMSVLDQIAEPLEVHLHLSHEDACTKALQVLRAVGLPEHNAKKLPGVMSGGQLQRAAIARAVALRPALLVCDEPVASLDVSIQAQVLALLNRLKAATHMAMLFVSHNLNVVRYLCDRAAVMYLGRIVELGPVDEVFHHPQHPYTRLLLASTPGAEDDVIRFYPKGVMPSPMERPEGCVFANRCPVACDRCRREVPQLEAVNDHHQTACFVKHSFITDAPLPGPSQQSGD